MLAYKRYLRDRQIYSISISVLGVLMLMVEPSDQNYASYDGGAKGPSLESLTRQPKESSVFRASPRDPNPEMILASAPTPSLESLTLNVQDSQAGEVVRQLVDMIKDHK